MRVFFLCLMPLFFLSQNENTDSLYVQLKSIQNDTSKINLLNKISSQNYLKGNISKAILFANRVLSLAPKTNYYTGTCFAYVNLGNSFLYLGESRLALENFLHALKISRQIKHRKIEANILEGIGLVYESQDNYEQALIYFFNSLRIREAIDDLKGIAQSNNNIGIIYYNLSQYSKAKEYYNKSLSIHKKYSNLLEISTTYNNLGLLYLEQNKIDSAINMHRSAMLIENKLNNKSGLALSFNNIGLCFRFLNMYDSALFNHLKSLDLNIEVNNKKGIALSAYNVGEDFYGLNNIKQAKIYADISLKNSQIINNLYTKQSAIDLLSRVFEKNGNYKMALVNERLRNQINDSIYNLESQKNMADMTAKYETEKKDKQLIKLAKEKHVKQLEIDKQKSQKHLLIIVLSASIIIIAILVLFSIIVKRTSNKLKISNKILTKRNIEIEEKKEEINKQAIQIIKYQAQMNPHFIFNAINGIQGMILEGDKLKAVNLIQAFSKLLRLTLNNSENDYLSIQNEIDYLNKYVEFELHTFSNKFRFNISVDSEINLSAQIPTMLIQPIIENAIKHADLDSFENGLIQVTFSLKEINEVPFLQITINDNGKGINSKKSDHVSKGISITKHRIALELKKNQCSIDDYFIIKSPTSFLPPYYGTSMLMVVPYIIK